MDVYDLPGKFTCQVRVGRVIEARVLRLRSPGRSASVQRRPASSVASFPVGRTRDGPSSGADHRPVNIYPPEVADELARLFSQMNARLARVGIIAARSNATLAMQLGRIVARSRQSQPTAVLRSPSAGPVLEGELSELETARLRAFLDEHPAN